MYLFYTRFFLLIKQEKREFREMEVEDRAQSAPGWVYMEKNTEKRQIIRVF